jgi:hypothetical protein
MGEQRGQQICSRANWAECKLRVRTKPPLGGTRTADTMKDFRLRVQRKKTIRRIRVRGFAETDSPTETCPRRVGARQYPNSVIWSGTWSSANPETRRSRDPYSLSYAALAIPLYHRLTFADSPVRRPMRYSSHWIVFPEDSHLRVCKKLQRCENIMSLHTSHSS